MNEDRFDELMRDAAQTFRKPPVVDFDEMWKGIDERLPLVGGQTSRDLVARSDTRPASRNRQWLAIAATLVLGIGLGRVSTSLGKRAVPAQAAPPVASAAPARPDSALALANNPYEVETSKYLGQTAALLIALPSEVKSGRANQQFVGRAGELLTTTRLLIDSPASSDPDMRNLLEDLELVLAQVVRLQNNHSRTELDLINRALEQRDVITRLRTAAAVNTAN
jgi:hypothetical protein